jgi:anti-sigma factor RsiW
MMQSAMHDQQMPHQRASDVPPAVLENFYWMMSLALDGLLDEPERAEFESYQAQYPALAALWGEWQGLNRELERMPHIDPAPGFVNRFELRLAQHEAQQQQRVLAFSLAAVVLVALLAVAGAAGAITYLTSTQGPWLGEQIRNLVLLSATTGAWLNALLDTFGALAGTPQAQALGMMYVVVAVVMIFGWVQLLRRSARLPAAVALPGME